MNQDQTTAEMIFWLVDNVGNARKSWHRTWIEIRELPAIYLPPISSAEDRAE